MIREYDFRYRGILNPEEVEGDIEGGEAYYLMTCDGGVDLKLKGSELVEKLDDLRGEGGLILDPVDKEMQQG